MNNENQKSSKEVETNKKENITMNTNIETINELTKQEVSKWEKEAESMNEYVLNAHSLGKRNKDIFRDLANACHISESKVRHMVGCHRLKMQLNKYGQLPQLNLNIWIQVLDMAVPGLKQWEALNYCHKHNLSIAEFRKYLEDNFIPLPRKGKNLRKYLLKFRELLPDLDIKNKIKKSEELRNLLGYLVSQSIANKLINIEEITDQLKIMNQPQAA